MRTPQRASVRFHLAFAVLGVTFLAIFSWVFLKEYLAEWRTTQAQFDQLQRRVKDPHALSLAAPLGEIQQIWLPDLNRVDRCPTCHLGIDDPAFVSAPEPYTTHPGAWLRTHAPDRFGCTSCHGGQGEATDFRNAAHQPIPYWSDPMRSPQLIEANCGACHRERRPRQAVWLEKGREVIANAGCIACHDIPGFSLEELRAPRLESVGYKVRPEWLRTWLADPKAYLAQARMPNFRLEPPEIDSLSAFLLAQRETAPLDSAGIDWSKADRDRGRTVFGEARCVTCHRLEGRGGTMGPELTTVGSKVGRAWLFSFIKDPTHDQPGTLMLRYRFTDDQIRDLVAYLTEDLIDPGAPQASSEVRYVEPALIERGREAFVRHGCYGCHRFSGMVDLGKIGPSLLGIGDRAIEAADFRNAAVVPSRPNWLFLKLRAPDTLADQSRMPTFNFSEPDAAAAVVALLSIRRADLPVSRVTDQPRPVRYEPQGTFGALVARYRCLSCHQTRGWGGELSTVPLDRIGSQLQHAYLVSYLQLPSAVRVSLEERMPWFRMTREEARTLADYLAGVFVDDSLERPVPLDADAARRGARLYQTLGCRGCHSLGGTGGYVGPDLSDSGRRLKPGWIEAWLSDPGRWKPGTLQPNYGLKPEEARSLTAYLMTLSTDRSGSTP
ncbi:MAG: c-type cytochrome [Acidobacteria bacterium]|nr:c-type cytochrome [Acidobacteriota bacterium]